MNFTALRSMVALFLTDTCTISGPTTVTYDPELGHDIDTAGADLYDGACRVAPSSGARVVEAGEGPTSVRLFDVTLPWDTTGIEVDQLVTVTASNDPQLVARILRVVDVQGMTDGPYRRLVCEDTLTLTSEEGS